MSTSTNTIPISLPPRISSVTHQKIPRIIHQTFKTNVVTDIFYQNAKSFIDLNPEYQYEFYDDERVKRFIENFDCTEFSFNRDTLIKAYNDIKPGAGKADIFRYLIIYEYGGVYVDIDARCV
jgi:mannosyltransferase OCH1-like enzyme